MLAHYARMNIDSTVGGNVKNIMCKSANCNNNVSTDNKTHASIIDLFRQRSACHLSELSETKVLGRFCGRPIC